MRFLLFAFLGLCWWTPEPAAAQPHRPVGVERPGVLENWQERLSVIEEQLKVGDWKAARNKVEILLEEMVGRIESGEGVAQLLGVATFFRAVAEAGLGNTADANWDYTTAQTLAPTISKVDLAPFGAAGKMLETWRVEEDASAAREPEGGPEDEDPGRYSKRGDVKTEDGRIVKPPKKVRSPKPEYPFGKYSACLDGPIEIRVVIDEDGQTTDPEILSAQDPLLSFAALEALREWRFKPARVEGKPVAVYYNLKVNFKISRCSNMFARGGDS